MLTVAVAVDKPFISYLATISPNFIEQHRRGCRHWQALFLLAPFTGVADIAGSIVGDTLASMFSLNQWDNKVCVLCPAFDQYEQGAYHDLFSLDQWDNKVFL